MNSSSWHDNSDTGYIILTVLVGLLKCKFTRYSMPKMSRCVNIVHVCTCTGVIVLAVFIPENKDCQWVRKSLYYISIEQRPKNQRNNTTQIFPHPVDGFLRAIDSPTATSLLLYRWIANVMHNFLMIFTYSFFISNLTLPLKRPHGPQVSPGPSLYPCSTYIYSIFIRPCPSPLPPPPLP